MDNRQCQIPNAPVNLSFKNLCFRSFTECNLTMWCHYVSKLMNAYKFL